MDKSRLSQGSQDSSSESRDQNENNDEKYICQICWTYFIHYVIFSTPSIVTLLKQDSSNSEIIEAFKQPLNGLPFLNTYHNLPNLTFVTADVVNWLMNHMEGISTIGKAVQVCSAQICPEKSGYRRTF